MKPYIVCHMEASLDGSIHPSKFTASPDCTRADLGRLYEEIHQKLEGDAWIVGRVTMAEMSKAGPHAPVQHGGVSRPYHFATRTAGKYAITIDPSGKVHFSKPDIGGDHVVVLLGRDVPDSHLAELEADGVSYIVAGETPMDVAKMLDVLGRELGIRRLLLEGGAIINGSFFAAGLIDELSLLVAPALDGRAGTATQSFAERGDTGLAGKTRLSFASCDVLEHGVVHLRYKVLPA
jgi:riboflavin biosynthesis pyrimidine reductase